MEKITDLLKKRFTYSVELVPPRNSTNLSKIHTKLKKLEEEKVDFISCTKGAGGSLRAGTLPITYYSHAHYNMPSIAHFTCRQINRFEVENNLVDMAYFGVKNVLALRGDPPDNSEDNDWDGEYNYAYELVEQIQKINDGKYIIRAGKDDSTQEYREGEPFDFCIGVAAHPMDPPETRIKYLQKKVEAGAHFAITQMIFDAQKYKEFVQEARDAGITIPIIPGVWTLETPKKLAAPARFGINLPEALKSQFEGIIDDEEFRKKGIECTTQLCRELKNAGAPGIHLFIFQNVDVAVEIINKLRE